MIQTTKIAPTYPMFYELIIQRRAVLCLNGFPPTPRSLSLPRFSRKGPMDSMAIISMALNLAISNHIQEDRQVEEEVAYLIYGTRHRLLRPLQHLLRASGLLVRHPKLCALTTRQGHTPAPAVIQHHSEPQRLHPDHFLVKEWEVTKSIQLQIRKHWDLARDCAHDFRLEGAEGAVLRLV